MRGSKCQPALVLSVASWQLDENKKRWDEFVFTQLRERSEYQKTTGALGSISFMFSIFILEFF